ncbi:MAG: cytochrome c [Bacteroidota bacterium]
MARYFILSVQYLFLFLTSLFIWLCFYNWTNAPVEEAQFGCGVISPEDNIAGSRESDFILGKQLFRANCASCHAGDMRSNLTGPALINGLEAWSDYPVEDLHAFIRNSQAMIEQGHPRALAIWREYDPTIMNSFENLSDEEMEAVLEYIEVIGNYAYD